jgi:hypothetical protein
MLPQKLYFYLLSVYFLSQVLDQLGYVLDWVLGRDAENLAALL